MKRQLRKGKGFGYLIGMCLLVAGLPALSQAALVGVSYDMAIGQADTVIGSATAVIKMDYSAGVLSITLQNTSTGQPAGAAGVLTGIGFNLPGTLQIASGTVAAYPSGTPIVTTQWGFTNSTSGSSGFYSMISPNTINANVRTVTSGGLTAMSGSGGVNVDGPSYGVLAVGGNGGGLTGLITDTVLLTLHLTGSYVGDVVGAIDRNFIVVGFGSPTEAPSVPEASALMLFGTGLVGLVVWRRKTRLQ